MGLKQVVYSMLICQATQLPVRYETTGKEMSTDTVK